MAVQSGALSNQPGQSHRPLRKVARAPRQQGHYGFQQAGTGRQAGLWRGVLVFTASSRSSASLKNTSMANASKPPQAGPARGRASLPFREKARGMTNSPLRMNSPWKTTSMVERLGVEDLNFNMGSLPVILVAARVCAGNAAGSAPLQWRCFQSPPRRAYELNHRFIHRVRQCVCHRL